VQYGVWRDDARQREQTNDMMHTVQCSLAERRMGCHDTLDACKA
jgi:hypothetical protein